MGFPKVKFTLAAIILAIIASTCIPVLSVSCSGGGMKKSQNAPEIPAETDNQIAPRNDWTSNPAEPQPISGKYVVLTVDADSILAWAEARNVVAHVLSKDSDTVSKSTQAEQTEAKFLNSSLVELELDDEINEDGARSVRGVLSLQPRKKYIPAPVVCSDIRVPSFLPNDPFFIDAKTDDTTVPPTLLPYQKTTLEPVSIEGAWDFSRGTDIKIALISSGVYKDHPDLAGRISTLSKSIEEVDSEIEFGNDISEPDPGVINATGTYLAGIVAANMNEEEGIAGIAPECTLVVLKTGHVEALPDPTWVMSDIEVLSALDVAIEDKVSAVLLPLAVLSNPSSEPLIEDALARCAASDIMVVVPAGDGSPPVDASLIYPANSMLDNVIAVGGLNIPTNMRSTTSNFDLSNETIDFAAPGFALVTTDLRPADPDADPPITGYVYASGTVMSSAIATGTIALIGSVMADGQFQVPAVSSILLGGIDTWSEMGVTDQLVGGGRLNINKAVGRAYAQVNIPYGMQIVQFNTIPPTGTNGTALSEVFVSAYIYGGVKPYRVRVTWGDGTSYPPGSTSYAPYSTETFNHVYSNAGTYPVTVSFKDAAGQEKVKATTFVIMRPLTATISAESNDLVSMQYIFSASYMNADKTNPSFAWDFNGDWKWDNHDQNPVYTYDSPGIYNVNFQMADNRGSITRTMELTVE